MSILDELEAAYDQVGPLGAADAAANTALTGITAGPATIAGLVVKHGGRLLPDWLVTPDQANRAGEWVTRKGTYPTLNPLAQAGQDAAAEFAAPYVEQVAGALEPVAEALGPDAMELAGDALAVIPAIGRVPGVNRFRSPRLLLDEPRQPTRRTIEQLDPREVDPDELKQHKRLRTAYEKAQERRSPAARRRDRNATDSVLIDVEAIPDRHIMLPEEWEGSPLVPIPGDRSVTGGRLLEYEGVPMDVPLQGGALFAPQHAGTGMAWASNLGAARNRQNMLTYAGDQTGRDPIGVYMAMGRDAIDFSQPPSEIVWNVLHGNKVPRRDMREIAKKVRETGARADSGYKGEPFLGFSDEGREQLRNSGALRNVFMDTVENTASLRDLGMPEWLRIRDYLTQPELRDAPALSSGFTAFRGAPGESLLLDSKHASYNRGIPGEYIGGLKHQVPADIMYPDMFRSRFDPAKTSKAHVGNVQRSIQTSGAGGDIQIATPMWVDMVSEFQQAADRVPTEAAARYIRHKYRLPWEDRF